MELHTNDLSSNSEKTLRKQLIDNFQLISKEVGQLDKRIDELSAAITNYEKVTDKRLDKIEKLLYGENPQLIEGDQGDHEPPNPHVVEITS